MKLLKSIIVLTMLVSILGTPNIAYAKTSNKVITEDSSIVYPNAVITYEKTTKRTFYSISSIPESYYYQEFNDMFQSTFSGTLYLQSVQSYGSYYVATYSGTLFGSGL